METRTITEIKIYKLILNPMMDNTENCSIVAIAYDKQKLLDWYNSEKVEPYYSVGDNYFPAKGDFPENIINGQRFYKVFRQGGLLEWYNPMDHISPEEGESVNRYGQGISHEWAREEAVRNCGIMLIQ